MPYGQTSQVGILAVVGDDANYSRSSQFGMLAVFTDDPIAKYTRTSQLGFMVVEEEESLQGSETSQLGMLVVFGLNEQEDFEQKAWSFILDGHKYYVLRLGELGTYVFDFTAQQWSKWRTQGYNYWNNHLGLLWNNKIIAADKFGPVIWEIDMDYTNDEGFRDIYHEVTAIIPSRMREWQTLDALYLTASAGYVEEGAPTLTVEFSDDRGNTWETPEDGVIQLIPDEYAQEFSWLSLGSFTAPGRVIRVSDFGGPVTLESLDMRLNGEE